MKVGQRVYTVNSKTNDIDTWTCSGFIPQENEPIVHLTNGKRCLFLPKRCVFETVQEAIIVAEK